MAPLRSLELDGKHPKQGKPVHHILLAYQLLADPNPPSPSYRLAACTRSDRSPRQNPRVKKAMPPRKKAKPEAKPNAFDPLLAANLVARLDRQQLEQIVIGERCAWRLRRLAVEMERVESRCTDVAPPPLLHSLLQRERGPEIAFLDVSPSLPGNRPSPNTPPLAPSVSRCDPNQTDRDGDHFR